MQAERSGSNRPASVLPRWDRTKGEVTMSLSQWLAQWDADREARTRREHHGSGVIILLDEVPIRACGCLGDAQQ